MQMASSEAKVPQFQTQNQKYCVIRECSDILDAFMWDVCLSALSCTCIL